MIALQLSIKSALQTTALQFLKKQKILNPLYIFSLRDKNKYGGCSLTVECQTVALKTRVRLPSSASLFAEGLGLAASQLWRETPRQERIKDSLYPAARINRRISIIEANKSATDEKEKMK